MRVNARASLLGAVVAVLALAGCGGSKPKPPAQPPPPAHPLRVRVTVRTPAAKLYVPANRAARGDTLDYRIEVYNGGELSANDVRLADRLPRGVTYVPQSASSATYGALGQDATASPASDTIVRGGAPLGNFPANSVVYVGFQVRVGRHAPPRLRNAAVVSSPETGRATDAAVTQVR